MISIKYNADGKITNKYVGDHAGGWTKIADSDWPDADPGPDEYPVFYYDEATGEITVRYKTTEGNTIR